MGFGIVFLLIPVILGFAPRLSSRRGPELHHLHGKPVPRFGGLALVVAFAVVELFLFLCYPQQRAQVSNRNVVVLGSLAMFAVGFWDDLLKLGAKRKLAGQLLVASFVCLSGIGIETLKVPFWGEVHLHAWGGVLTVLWLVGITNLINLIDGVDGLAGGVALMLMALLVYVGIQNGTFVLLTAGMTGALLAFLWFNFPPARIYLGDGGAYFLGFQIAIFSLVGSHKGTVAAALTAPLFVLALPIVDTAIAILRRGLRGLPLFRADRNHIHHRLLRTGMSRRRVVLSLYAVSMAFLMMGFVMFWSRGNLAPILLGAALLLLLLCAGRLSFSREWFAVGRTLGNSLAMREQIQYALSLNNWLRHEARRCSSLEELYADLVFASKRLGFTTLRVSVHGEERTWSQPIPCGKLESFRHELHGVGMGRLELQAPTCPHPCSGAVPAASVSGHCAFRGNPRLFEVMADLVAEPWLYALGRQLPGLTPMAAGAPEQAGSHPPGKMPAANPRPGMAQTSLPLGKDSAAA